MLRKGLPYFTVGQVVKGFGRGSKQLGIPTANFPESVVDNLPKEIDTGVYYGWANVDGGPVYKMVMSIGWNPYYKNKKKSMETHIMHSFPGDFYGSCLRICILGYLRPERNFSSIDELITQINKDINDADETLDGEEFLKFKSHDFFSGSGQIGVPECVVNGISKP